MEIAAVNIARFHPLLVHLPIGILLIAILLELIKKKLKFDNPDKIIQFVFLAGFLGATASITTGFMLASQGTYPPDLINVHKLLGISTGLLSLLLFLSYFDKIKILYRARPVLVVVTIAIVLITGHFGGSLTHGPGFLFEHPANIAEKRPVDPTVTHHIVEIKQMKYFPDDIEVNKGDTITFINKDFVSHDVTEKTEKKWTSSVIEAGDSWSLIAEEAVEYFCSLHVVMKGKIRIKKSL